MTTLKPVFFCLAAVVLFAVTGLLMLPVLP
jgi:hypothetical protein